MVVEAVLVVGMIVTSTANVAIWAFQPNRSRPARLRRVLVTFTVIWAIVLPAGGAASLAIADGSWPFIVIGAVALACWPVAILALRKHRATR